MHFRQADRASILFHKEPLSPERYYILLVRRRHHLYVLGDTCRDSAEDLEFYDLHLALPDQPASSNIFAKAHFSLGQVYQLRNSNLGEAGLDAKAAEEYQQVLKEYEAGDDTLKEIASHAYARMSLLSVTQGNYETAEDFGKKAYEISSPHFRAENSGYLGLIYFQDGINRLNSGDEVTARQKFAYAKKYLQIALDEAEADADQDLIDTFRPRLDELITNYSQYLDATPVP